MFEKCFWKQKGSTSLWEGRHPYVRAAGGVFLGAELAENVRVGCSHRRVRLHMLRDVELPRLPLRAVLVLGELCRDGADVSSVLAHVLADVDARVVAAVGGAGHEVRDRVVRDVGAVLCAVSWWWEWGVWEEKVSIMRDDGEWLAHGS